MTPEVLSASLDPAPFTIDDLVALASGKAALHIPEAARDRLTAARAVVERYAALDEPVYGLTTALGGNLGLRIEPADRRAFQEQIVLGRAIGAGEPLPELVCRAALIARCISLAKGGAGVSPSLLDLLCAMVEKQVTPVIPRHGSIGAGDLGLAAHIGAVVIGRGEAWYAGERLPGGEALAAAGLAPVELAGRDGHALCSTSVVTTGHAAVVLAEAGRLLLFAAYAAALAAEGFAANAGTFDAGATALRPAARQEDAAALFRLLLEGSYLNEPGAARDIQDALSFRAQAQVTGAVLQAFGEARREVETELNAVSESPVVLLPEGRMLSTANFHTPAIALAFDALAIAFTYVATASFHRVGKLLTPALSGLPKYLSPVGGSSAGYVPVQKLCASLLGEVRLRSMPASLDAMPVSDLVEDIAPQTPLAIAKLADQLPPLRILGAVEALVAAQAVDLRGEVRLAARTRRLYEAVRAVVPHLEDDREPAPDIEQVAVLAADLEFLATLESELGGLDLPFLRSFSAVAST
jgi:histidine ammonia-lyase